MQRRYVIRGNRCRPPKGLGAPTDFDAIITRDVYDTEKEIDVWILLQINIWSFTNCCVSLIVVIVVLSY